MLATKTRDAVLKAIKGQSEEQEQALLKARLACFGDIEKRIQFAAWLACRMPLTEAPDHGGWSQVIDRLIVFAQALGAHVEIGVDVPDCAGRCNFGRGYIHVGGGPALVMATVLAHEVGHWFSYLRVGISLDERDQAYREKLAYLYGWHVCGLVGARSLINKAVWKEAEEYNLRLYGLRP